MIEKLQLPLAVLSYGRAASVLIAHNVGKKVNVLPTYVNDLNEVGQINHCHLIKDCEYWKQRIFAVRFPLDAVLSMMLSFSTNIFHITVEEKTIVEPQHIDFTQFEHLVALCSQWYNFYTPRLAFDDLVIDYDQLNTQIDQSTQQYRKTYPDKKKLILNYDAAVQFFQPRVEPILPMYQKFLEHKNSWDIYKVVSG